MPCSTWVRATKSDGHSSAVAAAYSRSSRASGRRRRSAGSTGRWDADAGAHSAQTASNANAVWAFGRSSTPGMPSLRAVASVRSAPSGQACTMSKRPGCAASSRAVRRRDRPSRARARARGRGAPSGRRASTPARRSRRSARARRCPWSRHVTPMPASPVTSCQAVVPMPPVPIRVEKLNRTRGVAIRLDATRGSAIDGGRGRRSRSDWPSDLADRRGGRLG